MLAQNEMHLKSTQQISCGRRRDSNSFESLEGLCGVCQIPLVDHELGRVCPQCGVIYDDVILDVRPTYFDKRGSVQTTSYSPAGFRTMLGNGSERTGVYRKLNHVHYIFSKSPEEAARDCFRTYAAALDVPCHMDDLLTLFCKIHKELPAYARTRNVPILCFGIFYQYQRQFTTLSLHKALAGCQMTFQQVKNVLTVLTQFDAWFGDAYEVQLFRHLARAQTQFHLSIQAIGVIKGILIDPSVCLGARVNVIVGKALVIYYKSLQLQAFFQLVKQEGEITNWISLSAQLASSKWKTWIKKQLPMMPLFKDIAAFFEISPSQIYDAYNRFTWMNQTLFETPAENTVEFGTLKVPEGCFDVFFRVVTKTVPTVVVSTSSSLSTPSAPFSSNPMSSFMEEAPLNSSVSVITPSSLSSRVSRSSQSSRSTRSRIPIWFAAETTLSFMAHPPVHRFYSRILRAARRRLTRQMTVMESRQMRGSSPPRGSPCGWVGLSD